MYVLDVTSALPLAKLNYQLSEGVVPKGSRQCAQADDLQGPSDVSCSWLWLLYTDSDIVRGTEGLVAV